MIWLKTGSLGLKARENYEHPAATVILIAHRDLEALVLTRQEFPLNGWWTTNGLNLLMKDLSTNPFMLL